MEGEIAIRRLGQDRAKGRKASLILDELDLRRFRQCAKPLPVERQPDRSELPGVKTIEGENLREQAIQPVELACLDRDRVRSFQLGSVHGASVFRAGIARRILALG